MSGNIHINEKENLKFDSFYKELEELHGTNRDDNLSQAIEKIKTEKDKVSYSKLIDLLFSPDKNIFLQKENKVDNLLSLLNIKHKNICDIEQEYKKYKKLLDKLLKMLMQIIDTSKYEINEEKYSKFISKYDIKANSKEIFEYLDNIIEYIMSIKIVEENEKGEKNENDRE